MELLDVFEVVDQQLGRLRGRGEVLKQGFGVALRAVEVSPRRHPPTR